MKKLHKEPLFHFLIIGAMIFILFSILNKEEDRVSGNKIFVSTGDIERLSQNWSKKWNRPPTKTELTKEMLTELPAEMLGELRSAAVVLDRSALGGLVERIEIDAHNTAKVLHKLADNLQFGRIQNLLRDIK